MKTLILLHGWGANGTVWRQQAQAFQSRLEVLTPTIPVWDPGWLAGYLQNYPLADCLLVGWSLGGMLLLEALAQQSPAVGGLLLVGVAPVFCPRPDHPWGQPQAAVRAMRRLLKSDSHRVLGDFARSCLSPEEEAFQGEVAPLFAGGDATNLAAGLDYLLTRDLRPLLPGLPGPCTLIQGDQDRIVPPEQARFLHDHLSGSSLRLLPGAGHMPFWTQTERVSQILEEILEEKPGVSYQPSAVSHQLKKI